MRTKSGFSLLELLIAMVITAILIGIACPSYMNYLVRSRRSQAEIALWYLASQLESFYSLQNTYQGATLEILGVKSYTDDHSYQLVIQSATDSSYQIAAQPLGTQEKNDHHCGVLGLNEKGERSVSGSATPDLCWN